MRTSEDSSSSSAACRRNPPGRGSRLRVCTVEVRILSTAHGPVVEWYTRWSQKPTPKGLRVRVPPCPYEFVVKRLSHWSFKPCVLGSNPSRLNDRFVLAVRASGCNPEEASSTLASVSVLPSRLTAGRWSLKPTIGVRIPG